MYVYIQSEPGLWTVGFYDPSGKWHGDSDHNNREEAANRVAFLNGSGSSESISETIQRTADASRYCKYSR
jgi:hypothetical protein